MKDKIIELGYSSREVDELISVSKDIEADYNKLKEGYPIQYLIGYVDFHGYKINVNESVLIPRYETEYLVEKAIKYCKKYLDGNIKILDIGTGSGAIAISLAKKIDSVVTATDILEEALEVAKLNAEENKVKINFLKADMLNNINDKYDLIISNPPYVSLGEEVMDMVKKYEPSLALYAPDNGLFYYEEILKHIKKNLNKNYLIAFEIGYKQASSIKEMALKYLGDIKVFIEKDLSGKDRYIFITNNQS